MNKLMILGSGAAPGVPSVARGWGDCDPNNPKNRRRRTSVYLQFGQTKILIDTSPDLRDQLLDAGIRDLDAVLYTHAHSDHMNGIDELREINRLTKKVLPTYATHPTKEHILRSYPHVVAMAGTLRHTGAASLDLHEVRHGEAFEVDKVNILPIDLEGHSVPSNGYIFNDGEVVYIADCMEIPSRSLDLIRKRPEILVMPLTGIHKLNYHMSLAQVLDYIEIIRPKRAVLNHMSATCDYEKVNALTPQIVVPAYDDMIVEW